MRAVRRSRPHAKFIDVMQMKKNNNKRLNWREDLPSRRMTHFCTRTCISTHAMADVTSFLPLFLFYHFRGEAVAHTRLLMSRLMATKGYGSPPPLAPGQNCSSGWLTLRKHYLGAAGDTFIEPVKLIKAMR